MSNNDIAKVDGQNTLSLNFGSIDLSNLTKAQQNALRDIVAKKQIELAADLAERKIKLESSVADIDTTLNAVDRLSRSSSSFKVSSTHSTASGSTTITAGKVKLFG